MKRYPVFRWEMWSVNSGGWNDFIESTEQMSEAKVLATTFESNYTYNKKWHIVDSKTWEIVDRGAFDSSQKPLGWGGKCI